MYNAVNSRIRRSRRVTKEVNIQYALSPSMDFIDLIPRSQ